MLITAALRHSMREDTGMKRLALSDTDKCVRDWFCKTTASLGCQVKVDAMVDLSFANLNALAQRLGEYIRYSKGA